MNTMKKLIASTIAATAAISAPALNAASPQSDTATDILTVVDSCEIKAVGIDFGIHQAGTNANAITSTTPNTDTANGNTSTGHDTATNSGAGADTGDFVSLTSLGLPTVLADLVGTALDNISTPGITAGCTATPTSIVVSHTDAANTVSLGLETTDVGSTYALDDLKMDTYDYDVTYTAATIVNVAATPLTSAIFVGVYTASGSIDAGQTLAEGAYQNVLTATMTY